MTRLGRGFSRSILGIRSAQIRLIRAIRGPLFTGLCWLLDARKGLTLPNERKPAKATRPPPSRRPSKPTAAELFKQGSKLAAREQWDEAIEAFRKAVQLDPGNLLYRRTLRGAEYRKYRNNLSGGFQTRGAALRLRAQLAEAKQKRNWTAVDRLAEEGLAVNPWDTDLNAELGDACAARGFRDVAVFAWQCALQSDPDQDDLRERIAEIGGAIET